MQKQSNPKKQQEIIQENLEVKNQDDSINDDDSNSIHKNIKKEIIKGRVAVDEWFHSKDQYHVYEQEKLYDCLMNQTNIQSSNNNNKFYIVQLLESDNKPYKYYIYFRWGRIGQKGQISTKQATLDQCIEEFDSKVYDKTKVGDYKILERFKVKPQKQLQDDESHYKSCQLPDKVKDLLQLIYDQKMMIRQMIEIGYDPERMPLGKLGDKTIKKGYTMLKKLSEVINNKSMGKEKRRSTLEGLSSEFYSYIPHNNGFKKLKTLSTNQDVKDKIEMLQSLEAVEIAINQIHDQTGNMYDEQFKSLEIDIQTLNQESEEYQLIQQYVNNTHGQTHSTYKLNILDIYELQKDKESKQFVNHGNRMLLWHGSRLTNFVGILSQGLKIAPPEAPSQGYMFGKGIYFADSVSKSANYCFTSKQNPIGLILLCDVSLGKFQVKKSADYNANQLEEGCSSTKGLGKWVPDKIIEFKDVQVPLGKLEYEEIDCDLIYNEYIVYNENQVKMKYLVKCEFKQNK